MTALYVVGGLSAPPLNSLATHSSNIATAGNAIDNCARLRASTHLENQDATMAHAYDLMISGKAGSLSVRTKGLESRPAHVVIFVHGAVLSGQTGFDLQVPGQRDYSMMDAFVERGCGAITFSVRGYAQSAAPPDPLSIDTEAAIEDLACVFDWARDQGLPTPALAGWSWGGRIAGRYTERHPERVRRLALMDPALGGNRSLAWDSREPWFRGDSQFFLDRLESEYTEPGVAAALTNYVLQHEPRSPNGIRLENCRGAMAAVPEAISRPTLMIYGSAAGRANYMQGGMSRLEFFERLATDDKAFVIVPGCSDYAHFQRPRRRYAETIARFLMTE
jgi:pimeloyl-ACP methyl ester carboxylesterase